MSTAVVVAPHLRFHLENLHPIMRAPTSRLWTETEVFWFNVAGQRARFEPFEGFRSAERQDHLLKVSKTTKVGPWRSAHQYGLAVDFAVRIHEVTDAGNSKLTWAWPDYAPWDELKRRAVICGLDIPIKWDRGHVEHPQWKEIQKLFK